MRTQLFALGIAVMLCAPAPALAQRMPHATADAFGGEIGAFVPQQDGMRTSPEISGFYEHYLTARNSLRAVVGWANPKLLDSTDHSTRQVRIGGELIHNWEGGVIHPFVGAGLGAYFLQRRIAGNSVGNGGTELGGTLLGGMEWFTSKTFSVKGEARYNIVSKWNGYDPSGLALTIGAKAYF